MAICVIVMLIWGAYYMYTRAVLSQDCYVLAFRASQRADAKNSTEPASYVSQKAGEQAGKKYFGAKAPVFAAKASQKEVSVSGETEIKHKAMGGYFLKQQSGWGLNASLSAKIRNDPKHIRRIKRLKDLGEKLK